MLPLQPYQMTDAIISVLKTISEMQEKGVTLAEIEQAIRTVQTRGEGTALLRQAFLAWSHDDEGAIWDEGLLVHAARYLIAQSTTEGGKQRIINKLDANLATRVLKT